MDYQESIESYSNIISNYTLLTPNVGVAAARNKGIDIATGQWIAFLDDDEYAPNYLSTLDEYIKANCLAANDLLWCLVEQRSYFKSHEGYTTSIIKPNFYNWKNQIRLYDSAMSIGTSFGLVINSEILSRAGYFDTRFKVGEDTDFLIRLIAIGVKPNFLSSVGILKHDHVDGRLTSQAYAIYSELNTYEKIFEKHNELLKSYPYYTKFTMIWACMCHYRNSKYYQGDQMAKRLLDLRISKIEKFSFFYGIKIFKLWCKLNLKISSQTAQKANTD